MIEFRQKKFGLVSNIAKFTSLGSTIGGTVAGFRSKKGGNEKLNADIRFGLLVGAALGVLAGTLWTGVEYIADRGNIKTTVNNRLFKSVIDLLKRAGLKEGKDFTRDAKESSRMKTKVCIAISRVDGDLKILINHVSDPKLKDLTKELINNIPNVSAVNEKMSDRFNDITITSISDSSADAGLITGIAERFIHSGYPVYLVEIG